MDDRDERRKRERGGKSILVAQHDNLHTVVKISIRHPLNLLIIFFITSQIPLKICDWYLDQMDISIHIRFIILLTKMLLT